MVWGSTFTISSYFPELRTYLPNLTAPISNKYCNACPPDGNEFLGQIKRAEIVEHGNPFAEVSAEDKLEHGDDFADLPVENQLKHSNDFADLPAELDLMDNEAEGVGDGNRFAHLPAEDKLVGKEAEEHFRFWPGGHRVMNIACMQIVKVDKTIGCTPGLSETTHGAKAVCNLDAVCDASQFAARMATLLADRDVQHPLVLFLRGQSRSGNTWLTRKLLEPVDGAQISITSIEGGAATRAIPRRNNQADTVTAMKRLLDVMAKGSMTAKTVAKQSSSRTVFAHSMDGLPLISIPGGEEVGGRPEKTRKIITANTEVLATTYSRN
ncbi:hypothetical protein FN846DRAFT_887148 [Sphaerosporella brunnea]|uniref:Uncharacterized protein n=1 Tax=Sphaerosporella brunnea TaxID=1250544 RepID=A0A5J5F6T1_9PEZI|nr:hypothetical protein FN846DRAFT_887148 [Sphaerosporella brunnea]